jgi:L-rhamnonate dehydratase
MRRRTFLGAGLSAVAGYGAGERLEIERVRAARVPFRPASAFGTKKFQGDDDPARHRWFGPFSQLTGEILVRIDTKDGPTGWGLGGGGGAGVYIIENHLRDLLMGADARNPERLWQQMFDSSSFYGGKGLAVMAMSGIDLALWDARAKQVGKPVHELLGGPARRRVPGYYTSNTVEKGLKLGFRNFKIPVPSTPAEGEAGMNRELDRLRSIRKGIGPDANLMIDCLSRWDVEYTIEFAEQAEEIGLYFIEEALYPYDVHGYRILCDKISSTRIASGEHEYTRHGFRELVRYKAADVLQPDVTWSGGLSECRHVLQLGAERGLPVIPHRGGSPYGLALIFASRDCPMAESFGTGESDNELWAAFTADFKDGDYLPNQKPGFGVELSEGLLRKYVPELL